jgi:F-type H+-transporting ATPase subunit b
MVYSPLLNKLSLMIAEGGLFDFNATLPGVACVILLLVAILNIVFYKPLLQIVETRNSFLSETLSEASALLLRAEKLTNDLEEDLIKARKEAQSIIVSVQEQTTADIQAQIDLTKKETDLRISQKSAQLLAQKEEVLKNLDSHVNALSTEIESKLLVS